MISIPLDHEIFTHCFMSLDMFQCLLAYSIWNLNRICTLLLCGNCVNLNYVELVHSAFQVSYILLIFCLFILLIFESLILKAQLKILIYLLLKITIMYSGTICNLVLYFPSLLLMCYHTFIIKKIFLIKTRTCDYTGPTQKTPNLPISRPLP